MSELFPSPDPGELSPMNREALSPEFKTGVRAELAPSDQGKVEPDGDIARAIGGVALESATQTEPPSATTAGTAFDAEFPPDAVEAYRSLFPTGEIGESVMRERSDGTVDLYTAKPGDSFDVDESGRFDRVPGDPYRDLAQAIVDPADLPGTAGHHLRGTREGDDLLFPVAASDNDGVVRASGVPGEINAPDGYGNLALEGDPAPDLAAPDPMFDLGPELGSPDLGPGLGDPGGGGAPGGPGGF